MKTNLERARYESEKERNRHIQNLPNSITIITESQ